MAEVKVKIDRDCVTIENTVIFRPEHIGVCQWFEFWENQCGYSEGYGDGYRAGRRDEYKSNHN